MDPRHRADEALARARARSAFVVTPDNATSPMDAANTVRIPRSVVGAAEEAQHPDTTQVLPNSAPPQQVQQVQQPQAPPQQQTGWPSQDYGQLPPNPYHAQRGPNEFGPLGSTTQHYPQY